MTVTSVLWRSLAWPGKEHLYLTQADTGWVADGLVMAAPQRPPFRFHYRIEVDEDWTFRRLETHRPFLEITAERLPDGELSRDASGAWRASGFDDVPDLTGCVDIDITVTPFTNTLPIRRLKLDVGASSEIDVAYLLVPEMRLSRARQRYTHLGGADEFDRYRFESLSTDFTAEIAVDDEGLVVDYPDLFTRV
jgi:hypothetical protein